MYNNLQALSKAKEKRQPVLHFFFLFFFEKSIYCTRGVSLQIAELIREMAALPIDNDYYSVAASLTYLRLPKNT